MRYKVTNQFKENIYSFVFDYYKYRKHFKSKHLTKFSPKLELLVHKHKLKHSNDLSHHMKHISPWDWNRKVLHLLIEQDKLTQFFNQNDLSLIRSDLLNRVKKIDATRKARKLEAYIFLCSLPKQLNKYFYVSIEASLSLFFRL